jgi:hypothetical protein
MSEVKIVKMEDGVPRKEPTKAGRKSKHVKAEKKPKYGILKGGKTARNKPRFEAVADPAKAPPTRKSSSLRILTEKGARTRRAKISDDARKMPIDKIRHTLRKAGMPIRDKSPEKLVRKIYEDAQEAGMLSQG